MVREIMRDEAFLAQKAEPATPEDLPVAQDLLDTLATNKERCGDMAANMIGVNKRRGVLHPPEALYLTWTMWCKSSIILSHGRSNWQTCGTTAI